MSSISDVLNNARAHIMELFTLYRHYIAEYYTDKQIEELFNADLSSGIVKKTLSYLASRQVTSLTESQAIAMLEILHTNLKDSYSLEDIKKFFKYSPVRRPLIQRAWSKFSRACKRCGNVVCLHKAKGLCRFCYHKVWVERQRKC